MNAAFAARLPFEMLHGVSHVDVAAIDARFFERAIEQLAGGPDERLSGEIFLVAGLLAEEQQLRAFRSFAEDGLRSTFVEMTSGARLGGSLDFREVVSLRHLGGMPFLLVCCRTLADAFLHHCLH